MVATLNGPTGADAAVHAQKEVSDAFEHAPIPHLRAGQQTVRDLDQMKNQGNASYADAQFMEATLSGPRGFYAVSHVTEEPGIAFVPVPILCEHTVVWTAESWDERRNHRAVILLGVLFMEVTLHGAAGVCVASHVTMEHRVVIVHAPILGQHTEDETAATWEKLLNSEDATYKAAQFTVVTRAGTPGVGAVVHVAVDYSISIETATILGRHTEDETAGDWDHVINTKFVTHKSVQFMALTLPGSACMNALALVMEELNILFVIATILGQHTEGKAARDLDQLKKAEVVTRRNVQVNGRAPMKGGKKYGQGVYFARDANYSGHYTTNAGDGRHMYLARVLVGKYCAGKQDMKFMEVTRRGAAGVFAVGHVTGELRLAIVHAPILGQHSEDETATNWETLPSEEDATHKAAQSTVATHSGPTGLLAAAHVTGGAVAAFVLVPVPLLQTVEET
ncbi:hypothetical protein AWC38_SpisGene13739, partial [Stylophora pistillata]